MGPPAYPVRVASTPRWSKTAGAATLWAACKSCSCRCVTERFKPSSSTLNSWRSSCPTSCCVRLQTANAIVTQPICRMLPAALSHFGMIWVQQTYTRCVLPFPGRARTYRQLFYDMQVRLLPFTARCVSTAYKQHLMEGWPCVDISTYAGNPCSGRTSCILKRFASAQLPCFQLVNSDRERAVILSICMRMRAALTMHLLRVL